MVPTKPILKILLNTVLWLLVTHVQISLAGDYSSLLSSLYKQAAKQDRPVILVLDDNTNRNGLTRHLKIHNGVAENNFDDRSDNPSMDNEAPEIKLSNRKPSTYQGSYYTSLNTRDQYRRPRYENRNDRLNKREYSYRNADDTYGREWNRNHKLNDRNRINGNRNDRYGYKGNRHNDKNYGSNYENDLQSYGRNYINENENRSYRNDYAYDRNDNINDRNFRNYENYDRYDKNNRDRQGRNYRIRGRHDRYNRNYIVRDKYNRHNKNRDANYRNIKPRDRNNKYRDRYYKNRNWDREDKINKELDEKRGANEIEKNILRSPLVQSIMKASEDLVLRDGTCDEEPTSGKGDNDNATNDPCESTSNACGDDNDSNISTKGIVDPNVSDPPPPCCNS